MASELLTENSKQCHVFQDLMLVLTTLANAGSGIGHVQLFRACAEWMRKGIRVFCFYPKYFRRLIEGLRWVINLFNELPYKGQQ